MDKDDFGDKTFVEKKAIFLKLSSVEIESENVDTLIAVTNSLYRDIIDYQIVSNYYNEFFDELWPRLEKQRTEMLLPEFKPDNDWWGSKVTKD